MSVAQIVKVDKTTVVLSILPVQYLLNSVYEAKNITLRGVPAQGDAERTVHNIGFQSHGSESVASVSFGAGRSGRNADAAVLQNVNGILRGDTGNGEA